MIIKAAKRTFNSDKICRSYCDFYFGVTFLEYTVDSLAYISVAESIGLSSTTFKQSVPKSTEFREITLRIGYYAVQGHPRSPSLVPIVSDFLLVINSNLAPILHRFRDIAFDKSKIAIFGYPSWV